MAHHRNAGTGNGLHMSLHGDATLEFDTMCSGLINHAAGAGECLLWTVFVAAGWQINHHKGCLPPPHHGLAMADHRIEINVASVVHAIDNHRQRVADQHQITMRVKSRRHRGGIGRQADNLTLTLQCAKGGNRILIGHCQLLSMTGE